MPVRARTSTTSRSRGSFDALAGHEPGCITIVQELREWLRARRDVATDDPVARRGVGPVPLDDPLEEEGAQCPQPLAVSVGRQAIAFDAAPGGKPHLEVFEFVSANVGDVLDTGVGQEPRANWRSTESAATTLRGARNVANWAR